MVDKFFELKRYQDRRHDLAEVGLILALVMSIIASATFAVSDELLSLWPALATFLHP